MEHMNIAKCYKRMMIEAIVFVVYRPSQANKPYFIASLDTFNGMNWYSVIQLKLNINNSIYPPMLQLSQEIISVKFKPVRLFYLEEDFKKLEITIKGNVRNLSIDNHLNC